MFKKIILASAMLAASAGVALADPVPYAGASLGLNVNSTNAGPNNSASVYRGVPLKVFVGYGGLLSQSFFLAGELTGTIGSMEINDANGIKTTYGYTISAIPGVMLNDNTLAFARLGYIRTRFSSLDSWANGATLGLGMQTAVTQNIDIRGEYSYSTYNSVGGQSSPRSDEFDVGFVYKID